MNINHYPQPFEERYPRLIYKCERIASNLWHVKLPNHDLWEIYAISREAAINQARQLYRLKNAGAAL